MTPTSSGYSLWQLYERLWSGCCVVQEWCTTRHRTTTTHFTLAQQCCCVEVYLCVYCTCHNCTCTTISRQQQQQQQQLLSRDSISSSTVRRRQCEHAMRWPSTSLSDTKLQTVQCTPVIDATCQWHNSLADCISLASHYSLVTIVWCISRVHFVVQCLILCLHTTLVSLVICALLWI